MFDQVLEESEMDLSSARQQTLTDQSQESKVGEERSVISGIKEDSSYEIEQKNDIQKVENDFKETAGENRLIEYQLKDDDPI